MLINKGIDVRIKNKKYQNFLFFGSVKVLYTDGTRIVCTLNMYDDDINNVTNGILTKYITFNVMQSDLIKAITVSGYDINNGVTGYWVFSKKNRNETLRLVGTEKDFFEEYIDISEKYFFKDIEPLLKRVEV